MSSFEYDERGLLIKEVVEPDWAQLCLSTAYSHDGKGNRESTSAGPCAGGPATAARTNRAYYEAQTLRIDGVDVSSVQGQFATRLVNAVGHEERREYDPRLGTLLKLTGPNGLETVWTYDAFGRKRSEQRADGTKSTWAYQFCSTVVPVAQGGVDCPTLNTGNAAAFVFTQSEWAANGSKMAPDKISYVDAQGRVLRVQTWDNAGNTVLQDNSYNALGQLVRSTQPYVLGQTQYASTSSYDKLGRVESQSSPDLALPGGVATTRSSYNGLSVTVTNPKGQTRTMVKNVLGQVGQVVDHEGNQVLYGYDALGQLTQTNAAGQVTQLVYDVRGRKVQMNDPSMGRWIYAYNVFGELEVQTDSLGQMSTMAYDELGRMKKRSLPDLVSDWFYDVDAGGAACGKSKGKLCEARAGNGYRRLHSYDHLGREHITRTAQDSTQALSTVSVAFDANTGRVQSQTWPTGYTASYSYSEWGYLREVSASGGGAPAARLQILAYDAQGRIRQYKQGEKIITSKTYNAATGRLEDIAARLDGQTDAKLFRQIYAYDSIGNLTGRSDTNTGVQDSFGYDNLNRLTTYTTLGGGIATPQTVQVAYDARGNITYKSDVGRYWYDTDRPNRLLHVTLEGQAGQQALTGTRALSYVFDDHMPGAKTMGNGVALGNGNLMYTVSHDSASGRHTVRWESYTSFNMPLEIKYTNIGQTQYQSNLGQVIAATAQYSCPAGVSLSGTQCVTVSTVAATLSYSCASNMQLRNGNQCWALVGRAWRYITGAAPVYSCPAGTTMVGTGSATRCQRTQVHAQAKVVGYSCPPNYSLNNGTQCRGTGGRLVIGPNDAALASSDRTLNFTYGPEQQRVKQRVELSNNAPTSLMGGTTWYLHGENNNLVYEREDKANGVTEHRHYLQAGGMTFALAVSRSGAGLSASSPEPKNRPTQLSYFQQDHLGSIAAVLDENGFLIEQMAYDPWGKRRFEDGKPDPSDSIVGKSTDRGYTEHEHLDEVGVIHMNGRLYDPLIGRFMSADPHVTYPYRLQSFNRYAYVLNNPLRFIDPSGFHGEENNPTTNEGGQGGADTNQGKDQEPGTTPGVTPAGVSDENDLHAGTVAVVGKRPDKPYEGQFDNQQLAMFVPAPPPPVPVPPPPVVTDMQPLAQPMPKPVKPVTFPNLRRGPTVFHLLVNLISQALKNSLALSVQPIVDAKISPQLGPRGWSEQDIVDAVKGQPIGSTRDERGSNKTSDGNKRDDPATVYGHPSGNGYVVVNDRTNEVVQVSDRNDPGWKDDGRINWR